ncbi:MAG TPA: hypothetical protein DEG47_06905, partial [Cyanobacteria bacterium UBA11148]|nr:hypothetical protein [Cyanobacteria bacterium UBA11148]
DIDQDCQTEGKIFFDFKHGTLEHHPKIYKMDLSDFGLQDNFLGGKKYTSTLSGAETKSGEEVDLTLYFFVSPSKSNSINSFSDLIKFLTSHEFDIDSGPNHEFVSGIQFTNSFYFYCNMPNDCEISNNFQRFETSFQMVPEPGSTGSLLGIGFLGAALLLKRSKYSR